MRGRANNYVDGGLMNDQGMDIDVLTAGGGILVTGDHQFQRVVAGMESVECRARLPGFGSAVEIDVVAWDAVNAHGSEAMVGS